MINKQTILNQLKELGAPQDKIVIVHSSLRAVGEVEGRADGLLDALIEYFTAKGGLLCIPTHTWANMDDLSKITLDLNKNETCIGTLPCVAAGRKDGIRSLHASHSMAVFGEREKVMAFVADEPYQHTPASPKGCFGKIYDSGGYVLLMGVKHNRNTYLHCVEEMMDVPNRLSPEMQTLTIKHENGEIEKRLQHGHLAVGIGDVSLHYPKYEPAFRYHGCIKDGFVGNAPTQLCDARKMAEVMFLIKERSGGKEILADDEPLSPELYESCR